MGGEAKGIRRERRRGSTGSQSPGSTAIRPCRGSCAPAPRLARQGGSSGGFAARLVRRDRTAVVPHVLVDAEGQPGVETQPDAETRSGDRTGATPEAHDVALLDRIANELTRSMPASFGRLRLTSYWMLRHVVGGDCDIGFFASRSQQLTGLLDNLADSDCGAGVTVVAGSDLTKVIQGPLVELGRYDFLRLYYASFGFASPDLAADPRLSRATTSIVQEYRERYPRDEHLRHRRRRAHLRRLPGAAGGGRPRGHRGRRADRADRAPTGPTSPPASPPG